MTILEPRQGSAKWALSEVIMLNALNLTVHEGYSFDRLSKHGFITASPHVGHSFLLYFVGETKWQISLHLEFILKGQLARCEREPYENKF